MAKPPPGTTDCVALIYLSKQPGADQSVEGDDSGEGSESSSQHALPANPVWLVDDAGKIVGDSQRMICPWMTGETEMSCYEKKKTDLCFSCKQERIFKQNGFINGPYFNGSMLILYI